MGNGRRLGKWRRHWRGTFGHPRKTRKETKDKERSSARDPATVEVTSESVDASHHRLVLIAEEENLKRVYFR